MVSHLWGTERYEEAVKRLYQLFAGNHIPWQSVHMGHLERFFDLIPQEDISPGAKVRMEWGAWEAQVKEELLPLWNVQQTKVEVQEFRTPSIDQVLYEHVFYLPEKRASEDGYLIEAEEDILSIRYEENKVLIKTKQESLQNAASYRLHQGEPVISYGYQYPVLSNLKKNNLAVRYLRRCFLMIKEIFCFLEYTGMPNRKIICLSHRSDIFYRSYRWNLWSTGVWGYWFERYR